MYERKIESPYKGTLFGHRNDEVLIHSTIWVNLNNIMLHERSQIEKTIFYMITSM